MLLSRGGHCQAERADLDGSIVSVRNVDAHHDARAPGPRLERAYHLERDAAREVRRRGRRRNGADANPADNASSHRLQTPGTGVGATVAQVADVAAIVAITAPNGVVGAAGLLYQSEAGGTRGWETAEAALELAAGARDTLAIHLLPRATATTRM